MTAQTPPTEPRADVRLVDLSEEDRRDALYWIGVRRRALAQLAKAEHRLAMHGLQIRGAR